MRRRIAGGIRKCFTLYAGGLVLDTSLALLYDDPAEVLAEALDLYAKTGSKARVRDFLFPKHRPAKRPGRPVRGAEAGGDALGIQPAAHGAAASARAAG